MATLSTTIPATMLATLSATLSTTMSATQSAIQSTTQSTTSSVTLSVTLLTSMPFGTITYQTMVCVGWGKKRDERTEGQGDSRIRKFDCHERVFYSNWTLYPDYISLDSVCLNFCFPKIQYHMSRLVERVPLGAGDAWRLNCLLPLSSTFKVLTFGTQMHCAHNFV